MEPAPCTCHTPQTPTHLRKSMLLRQGDELRDDCSEGGCGVRVVQRLLLRGPAARHQRHRLAHQQSHRRRHRRRPRAKRQHAVDSAAAVLLLLRRLLARRRQDVQPEPRAVYQGAARSCTGRGATTAPHHAAPRDSDEQRRARRQEQRCATHAQRCLPTRSGCRRACLRRWCPAARVAAACMTSLPQLRFEQQSRCRTAPPGSAACRC